MDQDWTAIAPPPVAEIAHGQVDDGRFRFPARLVRWRPDRTPESCTVEQLEPAGPEGVPQPWVAG